MQRVVLEDRGWCVRLHETMPAIVEASFRKTEGADVRAGERVGLSGAAPGQSPTFWVANSRTSERRAFVVGPAIRFAWRQTRCREAVGRVTVLWDGEEAVGGDLFFRLDGNRLRVGFENIEERPGFQLLTVRTAWLASASDADAGAAMVIPTRSGRLLHLEHCGTGERRHAADWFEPVPVGLVYHHRMLAAVALESPDDVLWSGVEDLPTGAEGAPARRACGLSVELVHRHDAPDPRLRFVAQPSACARIEYVAAGVGESGETLSWQDGARYLRRAVERLVPPPRYGHTVIYKIFCDAPRSSEYIARDPEVTDSEHVRALSRRLDARGAPITFAQAAEVVRRIHHLTDGLRQVVYLVGWQHRGHDTGYPDVFTVNPRLGGAEGLRTAIEEAARYGAVLSLHDNYDDAYRHSPGWDPEAIARDSAGQLMRGGVWAGGQSYILSPSRYVERGALERVRRTLAMLPIRESYHIDVLSAVPKRLDFHPEHPASAARNLRAKFAIVEAFNRAGVDVTSEGFTSWFAGRIGHAWHLQRGEEIVYAGERPIPFVPFIYHGHATYGGSVNDDRALVLALLYGATFSTDLEAFDGDRSLQELVDRIYLVNAPYLLLREREMTAVQQDGTRWRVDFAPAPAAWGDEGESFVEADLEALRYRVVVNGREVARDFCTFVPSPRPGAWLAYSRPGGELRFPAPPGWDDATPLEAVRLTGDGPGDPVRFRISGGAVRGEAPAGVPVRVKAMGHRAPGALGQP